MRRNITKSIKTELQSCRSQHYFLSIFSVPLFFIAISYLLYTSCSSSNSQPSSNLSMPPTITAKQPVYTVVVLIDKSKSALNTFGIPQLTIDEIFRFIDKGAACGGIDLYIYYIDDDCRDNTPFYAHIPPARQRPIIKSQRIGDESYQSYLEKTLKKFREDSAIEAKELTTIKNDMRNEITQFLSNIYSSKTQWTDVYGALNNAYTTLSSSTYSTSIKYIIAFSDLEQSLPKTIKYSPKLHSLPRDMQIIMVRSTSGESPAINTYQTVPTFDLVINNFLIPKL